MLNLFIVLIGFLSYNVANASSLSPTNYTAGKSIAPIILDNSQIDVTSKYTLYYPGTELKIVTFSGRQIIVGSKAGSYQIGAVNKTNSNDFFPLSLTISAGTPVSISLSSGNSQSKPIGSNLSPLVAKVIDQSANPVSGVPVTFTVTSGTAKLGGVSSAVVNTDINGLASSVVTLGSVAERTTITASANIQGATNTITFNETSLALASQASRLSVSSQSYSSESGLPFSFSVSALTAAGQVDSSFSGPISITGFKNNSCTQASTNPLVGTSSLIASSGVVNFTNLQYSTIEPLYIKMTSPGLTPACSKLIQIVPASSGLASLKIAQLPTLLKPNQNFFPAIKVSALDINGSIYSLFNSSVQINSYSDSACSTPLNILSNNSVSSLNGFATFARIQTTSPGTIYIQASSGVMKSNCSPALIVTGSAVPPVLGAISGQVTQAKSAINIQANATDQNSLALTYSYLSSPAIVNASISNSGLFSWTPTVNDIGSYSITIKATNSAGLNAQQTFLLKVIPSVTISSTTFSEGDVEDPIFLISVQGNKQIDSINFDSTLFSNFTPISADVTSGSSSKTIQMDQSVSNLSFTANSGSASVSIAGAVKFASSLTSISLTLMSHDGTSQTYSFPITIASKNLPYIKYDMYGVDNGTTLGGDVTQLYISSQEYKRVTSGWRTPILMRYREGPVTCNGTQVPAVYQDTDSTIINCLKTQVSVDAETVFFFSHVFSGTSELGGIAKGVRNGVIAQKYPWSHTLSHELGHNFGLFHTFETAFNPTVVDNYNGTGFAFYTLLQSTKSGDNRTYPGDFANDIITLSGSSPYSFNILDDTPQDYWGGVLTTLNTVCSFGYCPSSPYNSGDSVLMTLGGEGYGNESSYVCQQPNWQIGNYSISCNGVSPDQSSAINIMSYWIRADGSSVFTPGQKSRMDSVLGNNSVLTTR